MRRRVDGVLLLDKPRGLTSNGALARVKHLYAAEKGGHTGTLDPLASGLLPICFGEATKFAGFLLDAPKRYVATVRFGVTTSTLDAEGDIVATQPVDFGVDALRDALRGFVGPQLQTPPAHSALKLGGRPYYEYARAGIDIPRAPREVVIASMELLDWQPPDAVIDVECSKGTYVRTLADDVGRAMGCGAHLFALRRTRTGTFAINAASSLAAVERMDDASRMALLLPLDAPLAAIARLDLDDAVAAALAYGQRPCTVAPAGRYRVYGPDGRFAGVAEVASGQLAAIRLVDTRKACA